MQSGDRIIINDRDYQIGPVLSTGAGSYGQVWAATDAEGRAVALKLINTEAMAQADPALRGHWHEHLEQEIAFLDDLSAAPSPHIVTLFDHGRVGGQPVLVLERLQANLGQWLTQQRRISAPPDLAQILDWADQILEGLDVVHKAGFVYRDLKFSNLLVGNDGARLKLADFGSLRRENGDNTRSFIGTPATMAPEQILPARQGVNGCEYAVDYRADYYALGLLLFTLLTDRPATAAQRRLGQLLVLHGQEGAGQQREQLGGLDDEEREILRRSIEFWTVPTTPELTQSRAAPLLAHLIVRLLARDPNDRPADSLEIRAVLDAVRTDPPSTLTLTPETSDWGALPLPNEPPNWRPHRHGRRHSRSRQRLILLVGMLGLAGAMAWAIIRPSDEIPLVPVKPLHTVMTPPTPATIATPPEPITPPVQPESPVTAAAHRSEPGVDEEDQAATVPRAPVEPQPAPALLSEPESPAIVVTPTVPAIQEPTIPTRLKSPASRVRSSKPAAASVVTHGSPAAIERSNTIVKPADPVDHPSSTPPETLPITTPVLKIAKPAPKLSTPVAPPTVHRSPPVTKSAPTPVARANPAPHPTTVRSPKKIQAAATRAEPKPVARTEARSRSTLPDLPPIELTARARTGVAPTPSPAARPTSPDLPPIELTSRSRTAAPISPPIELVSRANLTSARPAPTLATPPVARTKPPSPRATSTTPPAQSTGSVRQFQNDASRAVTDIQRQAASFTHWVRHTSTTVGAEVQRGLETADRTVSQWTGHCNQADGCNQKVRVERRDRWSSRYGGGAAAQRDQ